MTAIYTPARDDAEWIREAAWEVEPVANLGDTIRRILDSLDTTETVEI